MYNKNHMASTAKIIMMDHFLHHVTEYIAFNSVRYLFLIKTMYNYTSNNAVRYT